MCLQVDQMFQSLGLDGTQAKSSSSANQGSSSINSAGKVGGASSSKQADPTPVRSPQVSLSLQEKQKLQKEQEFQQRLKTQKPIQPSETKKQAPKSQTKDLTTALMDSSPALQGQNRGGGMGTTPGSRTGGGAFMSSGMGSNTYNAPSMSTSGTNYTDKSPAFGASNASLLSQPMRTQGPAQTSQSQPKKNVDMSAFDSLLGPSQSQQSRKTLNQIPATNVSSGPTAQRQGGAFGNAGQASFGSVGQNMYGQQSQGAYAPMQQGMVGGLTSGGRGTQQMGQMSWTGSSMSGQQQAPPMGHKQGGSTGAELDPFTPKDARAGQNKKGGNLLDFLG